MASPKALRQPAARHASASDFATFCVGREGHVAGGYKLAMDDMDQEVDMLKAAVHVDKLAAAAPKGMGGQRIHLALAEEGRHDLMGPEGDPVQAATGAVAAAHDKAQWRWVAVGPLKAQEHAAARHCLSRAVTQ